jgi:bleomycin hydrolase
MKTTTLGLLFVLAVPFALAAQSDKPDMPVPEKQHTAKTFQVIREVWATPFKPQSESGTCWCFSTTSFLESEAHRLGRGDLELSPMFTVYHAYLEKAVRHVRSHGTSRFSEGGLAHDVLYVMRTYGAVPRSCYTGLLDDAKTHDQREMSQAVAGLLSGVIKSGEQAPISGRWINGQFEAKWLNALRATLDAYLGRPPAAFDFGGKQLTPRQFADEVLRLPFDDYVEITSYSQLPFYGVGELPLPDNWLHRQFYNVPLEDFVRLVDHALEHGYSLVLDLHTTRKETKAEENYLLGHDEEKGVHITQDQRDTLSENWRTADVHLVHAIGIAKDEAGKKFYKVKDSLADGAGETRGFHNKEYLSEEFLRSRVLFVLVHKDGLPADIRSRLGLAKD